MPYATLQTLIDQFGLDETTRSADRNLDGVPDVGVYERALDDASGEIDSYIAVVYKTPLDPVPEVVVTYAATIAMYRMSSDVGTLTEEKRKRYEDAIRWLRDVAAGKAVIGGAVEPESKNAGGIRMTASPREYTVARIRGIL
jgi:phage gp36-like protein